MEGLLLTAEAIAHRAHAGQMDKSGCPYIGHPLRVASLVRLAGGDECHIAVAFLHDVLEDSEYTEGDLLDEGIPAEVVDAVVALTKKKNEPYEDAIRRAALNPIAGFVKRFDIQDNTSPARMKQLDEETRTRLTKKYELGMKVLNEVSPLTD